MSFEEDAMDKAGKSLDATKTFCTSHLQKRFTFFSSSNSSAQVRLSPHEQIMRRCIVADCTLFEAILVFLKQGLTSYVKGGYLLRKAWKTYEKVYHEMENLCSCPSPISKTGTLSPTDRHVGTSIYDKKFDDAEEAEEELTVSVSEVNETLAAMDVGFAGLSIGDDSESCPVEGAETCRDGPQLSSGSVSSESQTTESSTEQPKPTGHVRGRYC